MTSATNSQVFLQNLENIAASYIGNQNQSDTTIQTAFNVMPNTDVYGPPGGPVGVAALSAAMTPNNFNSSTVTDINSFVNQFYNVALAIQDTDPLQSIPSSAYDPSNPQSPLNGLYNAFLLLSGNSPGANNDQGSIISDSSLPGQFTALFSDFIKNFNFNILSSSHGNTPVTSNGISYQTNINANYQNFFTAFLRYLSTTTVLQTASKSTVLNLMTNPTRSTAQNYIQSYQAIYESFNGPIGTLSTNSASWTVAQSVFVARLSAFYLSELAKTRTSAQPSGFFDASQDLSDWYNYTQNLYYNPQFSPNAVITDPDSTIILDKVLLSLINMISTIQTVAAAQANSLNFLSQWQEAYTNKLNQIHTFADGDGTVLGSFTAGLGTADWDQNASGAVRNALNNINQNYISKLQANQQTISDNSKSLQTNVNQSDDEANQQGSLADSVLQEMSTLLSSIFR